MLQRSGYLRSNQNLNCYLKIFWMCGISRVLSITNPDILPFSCTDYTDDNHTKLTSSKVGCLKKIMIRFYRFKINCTKVRLMAPVQCLYSKLILLHLPNYRTLTISQFVTFLCLLTVNKILRLILVILKLRTAGVVLISLP